MLVIFDRHSCLQPTRVLHILDVWYFIVSSLKIFVSYYYFQVISVPIITYYFSKASHLLSRRIM